MKAWNGTWAMIGTITGPKLISGWTFNLTASPAWRIGLRLEKRPAAARQAGLARVRRGLARVLSWALKRGLCDTNPCAEGGKLYAGSRVDRVWSDEDVARFLASASPQIRLAMTPALETGQRQGDLRKLT